MRRSRARSERVRGNKWGNWQLKPSDLRQSTAEAASAAIPKGVRDPVLLVAQEQLRLPILGLVRQN